MNLALIFAAGWGSRVGSPIPKQFLSLDGKPILIRTLEIFQKSEQIDAIILVTLENFVSYSERLLRTWHISKCKTIVPGGETCLESIFKGLTKIEELYLNENPIVLIHDGVRPFITADTIDKNVLMVKERILE